MHKFHVTFVTHGHRSESILDWWYRYRILTPRGQSSKITKCKISPKLFKIKPYFVLPTCINLYVPFHLVPWHLVLDDLEGLISRSKIKSSLRWILFHWDSATITAFLHPSWKKISHKTETMLMTLTFCNLGTFIVVYATKYANSLKWSNWLIGNYKQSTDCLVNLGAPS